MINHRHQFLEKGYVQKSKVTQRMKNEGTWTHWVGIGGGTEQEAAA